MTTASLSRYAERCRAAGAHVPSDECFEGYLPSAADLERESRDISSGAKTKTLGKRKFMESAAGKDAPELVTFEGGVRVSLVGPCHAEAPKCIAVLQRLAQTLLIQPTR